MYKYWLSACSVKDEKAPKTWKKFKICFKRSMYNILLNVFKELSDINLE